MTCRYNGVTGHRGNPDALPENTLASFENAIALGVDVIETDVRESADHVLFLCHDETTGRTCDRNLVIEKTGSAELRKLNAGHGSLWNLPLPTLDELLLLATRHPEIRVSLQPKCPAIGAICDAVKRAGLGNHIAFNDGNFDGMYEAKQRLPEAVIFYDTHSIEQLESGIEKAKKAGFFGIVAHCDSLNRERVAAIAAAGLEPGVWTVNDEAEMRKFFDMGVFRIYTDSPEKALRLKQEGK